MDLSAIKAQLEEELTDVLQKSGRLTDHLRNKDRTIPKDWSEMAQFTENDEVLEALESRARDRVDALRLALQRIEDGTYDQCGNCGATIAPERLETLPTTPVCAQCAI